MITVSWQSKKWSEWIKYFSLEMLMLNSWDKSNKCLSFWHCVKKDIILLEKWTFWWIFWVTFTYLSYLYFYWLIIFTQMASYSTTNCGKKCDTAEWVVEEKMKVEVINKCPNIWINLRWVTQKWLKYEMEVFKASKTERLEGDIKCSKMINL